MKQMRFPACVVGLAVFLVLPAASAAAGAYDDQDAAEICGYLPYRATGPARFAAPRPQPEAAASVGPQATYSLVWDLARPAFLAAETADDLLAGRSVAAVRDARGGALSLSEYMLFQAKQFDGPPPAFDATDERKALAAERARNFYRIYAQAKASFEAVVAHLSDAPPPAEDLARLARGWRPAFALTAKAQADDKRIELLATDLDADAVLEREAVVCLAHAVAALGRAAPADAPAARAQASAARWAERPAVNARALPREARTAFFEFEDAGDALAGMVAALPPGPVDDAAMRVVAKGYAEFLEAAKTLHARAKPE